MKRLLITLLLLPVVALAAPPPNTTANTRAIEVDANGNVVTAKLPNSEADFATGILKVNNVAVVPFSTDAELNALSGLTSAADRLPYFTGSGTASLATFSSFARTFLDDADASTVRGTIGAVGLTGNETISGTKTFSADSIFMTSAIAAIWGKGYGGYLGGNLSLDEAEAGNVGGNSNINSGDSPAAYGSYVQTQGASDFTGGSIQIEAGDGKSGSNAGGGHIQIDAGNHDGSGAEGYITMNAGVAPGVSVTLDGPTSSFKVNAPLAMQSNRAISFSGTGAATTLSNLGGQPSDTDLTTWAGITPGTGIGTALAINVGSAGAPVLFNGAGGTPSSLTLTNATGLSGSSVSGGTFGAVNGSALTALNGTNIASGTVPLARLPTGTNSSSVVVGGTITGAGPIGSSTLVPVITYNAAGQLTAVTTASIASGITIGTTVITSGASGRFLYDNAGVVGEVAGTGTGGPVLDTSATLTTPNIGAATGTSFVSTGASSNSYTGTASTPAMKWTGVPFAGTGTTSFPLVYINDANATASTTLNTAGTYLAVNGDGTQDLMNLLKDGTSQCKVSSAGLITAAALTVSGNILASVTSELDIRTVQFLAAGPVLTSIVKSLTDGTLLITNSGLNGFTRLQFGSSTNSFPGIGTDAVNGFTLQSSAGTATWNDASTANSGTVANRYLFGIAAPTLTSTGTSVTNTVASTVYIGGSPTDSTNTTSTTKYALNVAAGTTNLGGTTIHGAATRLKVYTVATLPASPTQGDCAAVSDALTPAFLTIIVGGGSAYSPVTFNGANWVGY